MDGMKACFIYFFLIINLGLFAQDGLLHLNQNEVSSGYVLFSDSTQVYLINNCGIKVHEWQTENEASQSQYLLPDGNLLFTSKLPANTSFPLGAGGGGGRLQIYAPDNSITWQYDVYQPSAFVAHHDVEYLPNGNILAIVWEEISIPNIIAEGRNPSNLSNRFWAEKIIEIEPLAGNDANIIWEWRVMDHLIQDFDATKNNFGIIADHPEKLNLNLGNPTVTGADWLHANSIDYNESLDQILISFRFISEIFIIDHSTTTSEAVTSTGGNSGKGGDFLWRYGNPANYDRASEWEQELFEQHDAKWIPDSMPNAGAISVFNNGRNRPGQDYSAVEIIIPPVDAVGNYQAPLNYEPFLPEEEFIEYRKNAIGGSFYSANRGGGYFTENGNLIICNGLNATFFELELPSETAVFAYKNTSGKPLFKVQKYASDYPGIQALSLMETSTIESPSSIVSQACISDSLCASTLVQMNNLPESVTMEYNWLLSGYPVGGTFDGNGVFLQAFNPGQAGAGLHTITYTYDDGFGCETTISQNVLVVGVTFNFVNYQLGIISP